MPFAEFKKDGTSRWAWRDPLFLVSLNVLGIWNGSDNVM